MRDSYVTRELIIFSNTSDKEHIWRRLLGTPGVTGNVKDGSMFPAHFGFGNQEGNQIECIKLKG